MCGVGEGGGVIFLYLVSYMFQSILNIFVFFEFFFVGKNELFSRMGGPPPHSQKIAQK